MPANTPNRGYPYPLPDDAIADYPALGRALAEQLDAELVLPPGMAPGDVLTWSGSAWVPVAGVATVSPPVASVPPALVGAVNAGATVTRGPATWTGNPTPLVSWDWLLNDVVMQAGGDDYAIPADASGQTLKLRELATNPIGQSSSEVSNLVNVGIAGGWRASRPFFDSSGPQALFFNGNPVGNGVLELDDWEAGPLDAPLAPAPGSYRVRAHMEFPNDWNVGYSGDGWASWDVRAGAQVQGAGSWSGTNTGIADIDQTFAGVVAGDPIGLYFGGGGTGKAARPNNFWLEIFHIG